MSAGRTLWRDGLAREEVVALLAAHWREGAYCQLERVEAVTLEYATAEWLRELQAEPASLWPQGRLFGPATEARWEAARAGRGLYQVLLVGDGSLAPPGDGWAAESFEVGPERPALLWGERRAGDDAWKEERLPKPQHYPVAWAAQRPLAALVTRDYLQGGLVRLTRFLRVEAVARPEVAA